MIKFGRNVQATRQALKISQEELAFRAGLHRTYIGMVERAERSISLQNAKKIADALNVKLDVLLNGIPIEHGIHLLRTTLNSSFLTPTIKAYFMSEIMMGV